MPEPFDWLTLIDKRAAIREQFPTLAKVRRERPGSASDNRAKQTFAADNQMAKVRHDLALWQQSADENERRRLRLEGERRRRAYNGYQKAKAQALSGPSTLEGS